MTGMTIIGSVVAVENVGDGVLRCALEMRAPSGDAVWPAMHVRVDADDAFMIETGVRCVFEGVYLQQAGSGARLVATRAECLDGPSYEDLAPGDL